MWCVEPPEDCTCKWRNTSDYGGWDLVALDQNCPEHSFGTDDPLECDPGAEAGRIAEDFDQAAADYATIEQEQQ